MDNVTQSKIQKFLSDGSLTVSEAMQQIDHNSTGILFLVDDKQHLIGCVTDGDVRRFLLAGGKMSSMVLEAANRRPIVAYDIGEAKSLYDKRNYIVIPIISKDGIVVDLFAGENEPHQNKRDSINIPVVINAGGKGTRLEPYTKVLPKPLIPVGELPIIEIIMQEYQSYACFEFHIIVNYKKELMKAYFANGEKNYNITWYDEEKPLGTGGGLSLLKGKLAETFFFANCDVLLTANYEEMLKFHRKNGNVITMICAHKNISIPYGVVEAGASGTIESMKEKPIVSFLTNTGIYIVEPEVLDDMVDGECIGFPDIVERQRQKGRKVAVFPVSENDWMDMGQISELEKMRVKLYGE